jgi:BirA family transcriptional regulator, biotin operon repressor / biotin---[acetyl-CoA-carboxylase] ligase
MREEGPIIPTFQSLDVNYLRQKLKAQLFGGEHRLLYFPVTDSTNTQAIQLVANSAEEGVVVIADAQTGGRGSRGRRWLDIPGNNIILSIVLYPLFPPNLLIKMASLGVAETITQMCNISPSIKWPNDTLIGKRKVSGILIETKRISEKQIGTVLGIGVNVNGNIEKWQKDLRVDASLLANATTLETECGQSVNRETFICILLQNLEAYYLALQEETQVGSHQTSNTIHERWRDRLSTLGRDVEVRQKERTIAGIAMDVNSDGELLLRCQSGEIITISWGEVGFPT